MDAPDEYDLQRFLDDGGRDPAAVAVADRDDTDGLFSPSSAGTCSWCRREVAGGLDRCPDCHHEPGPPQFSCSCQRCCEADPGVHVVDVATGKFLAAIDPKTGRESWTSKPHKARVWRSLWRSIFAQRPGVVLRPVPAGETGTAAA